ncbi:MAG: hypothetical protein ACETWQ_00785 [Phycisphaerae bacterium]
MGISGLNIKTLEPKSGAADAVSINKSLELKITIMTQSKVNKVGLILFPHIVKLMVLVHDPVGSPLLLLCSERAKSLDIDPLLIPADKPVWICFFGRFSGMKKAALEILSQICDLFFFSLKSIKWAGRWGRLYQNITGKYTMRKYHMPQPEKIRKIESSFAWIDHRLVRNGYLQVMTHDDMVLYLFLILAADRNGVSFYRKEKICDAVSLDFSQFEIAKDRLINMKLIAFESYSVLSPNGYYQVLPVDNKAPDYSKQLTQNITKQLTNKLFRE